MLTTNETAPAVPDMKVSVRQVFGIESDLEVPAYSNLREPRPGHRPGLHLRSADHAGDLGRIFP